MPKVVKKVVKSVEKSEEEFTLEIDSVSPGPYDLGYIFHGPLKVAQLTLIRCEGSKELIQVLKKAGIKVGVV